MPINLGISPSKETINDDFPAPTFPTTMTREPLETMILMLLRICFSFFESHLNDAHSIFTTIRL